VLAFNIGDALPNLQSLYLGDNYFESRIPPSVGNPSSLEIVDLSMNYFAGHIPNSFGNLSRLDFQNLELNMLEAQGSVEAGYSSSMPWQTIFL
jgi:Leucine-rich repeat (LRR) protein